MRLVFVHGINNEHRSSQQIQEEWLSALETVMNPSQRAAVRAAEVAAPYYGDVLLAHTMDQTRGGPDAIAQAAAEPASDEAEFYRKALGELAPVVGTSRGDLRDAVATADPIEQGLPHDRRLLAVLRAIEYLAPHRGHDIIKLLPQAFTYLYRQSAAMEVDSIVRPALSGGPTIVVAHSLGTIVTYKLLREDTTTQIPLFVTLGSPLSIRAVQNAIGPAFGRPECVKQWLNAFDPDDAVTLGRGLDEGSFGPGIDNIDKLANGGDAHSIASYLADRRVAGAFARVIVT